MVDCELLDCEVDVKLDGTSWLVLEGCSTGGRHELTEDGPADRLQIVPAAPGGSSR